MTKAKGSKVGSGSEVDAYAKLVAENDALKPSPGKEREEKKKTTTEPISDPVVRRVQTRSQQGQRRRRFKRHGVPGYCAHSMFQAIR
jgi:hypothetical protein